MKKSVLVKILCALCAFVLSVSFVGCANPSNPKPKPGEDVVINNNWWTTTGELQKDGDGNIVFNDVDIKLATVVCGTDKSDFNQLIARFNAQYRNKINVVSTSIIDTSFEETVSKQITNNSNPPDFIMSHQKSHKSFADNKLIQPIDEFIEKSGIDIDMDDYADGLAQYTSLGYKDMLFSVPCDAQSAVVFYNKKLLAKYGDTLPENRTQLLDLCDRVAAGEHIKPIAWATSSEFFQNYVFPTAVVQNGGQLYKDDYYADWTSAENMPAYKKAISSIRELVTRTPNALAEVGSSAASALSAFLEDKALFYFAEPWDMSPMLENYAKSHGITEEQARTEYIGGTSVAKMFAMDDDSAAGDKIFVDSHFFAMSKTVTDITKKAAILEFVKWFTHNGEAGADWGKAGHISISKVIRENETYNSDPYISDFMNKFYPDINKFECTGNTPYYASLRSNLGGIIVFALTDMTGNNDESVIRSQQKKFNDDIDFVQM